MDESLNKITCFIISTEEGPQKQWMVRLHCILHGGLKHIFLDYQKFVPELLKHSQLLRNYGLWPLTTMFG